MQELSGLPIAAFFVAALDATSRLLAYLFDEERRLAGGAGFGDRSIPQGKLTLRVSAAGIERTTLSSALLYEVSTASRLRAFHAKCERLGCLALRIG